MRVRYSSGDGSNVSGVETCSHLPRHREKGGKEPKIRTVGVEFEDVVGSCLGFGVG